MREADRTGEDQDIVPLDSIIVHMLLLADLLSRKRITEDNVASELARITKVSHVAAESIRPKAKNQRTPEDTAS